MLIDASAKEYHMTMVGFTPLNSVHCLLNESRIDLWQFSLAHELRATAQLLSSDEQARASRFYFDKHRRRFATGRASLRIILSRYLNTSPDQIVFTYNPQGKPEVYSTQKLQFNLPGSLQTNTIESFCCSITVEMLSQGASKVNISLVVQMKDKDRLIQALHARFFESSP